MMVNSMTFRFSNRNQVRAFIEVLITDDIPFAYKTTDKCLKVLVKGDDVLIKNLIETADYCYSL